MQKLNIEMSMLTYVKYLWKKHFFFEIGDLNQENAVKYECEFLYENFACVNATLILGDKIANCNVNVN